MKCQQHRSPAFPKNSVDKPNHKANGDGGQSLTELFIKFMAIIGRERKISTESFDFFCFGFVSENEEVPKTLEELERVKGIEPS